MATNQNDNRKGDNKTGQQSSGSDTKRRETNPNNPSTGGRMDDDRSERKEDLRNYSSTNPASAHEQKGVPGKSKDDVLTDDEDRTQSDRGDRRNNEDDDRSSRMNKAPGGRNS